MLSPVAVGPDALRPRNPSDFSRQRWRELCFVARLRRLMTRGQLRHVAAAPIRWAGHVLSNTRGILTVFDLVWLRRTPGGIIDITHPFATGIDPGTGGRVWRDNLLYRSRAAEVPFEDDVA